MAYEKGSREAGVIEEALFKDFKGEGFTAYRCPIYDVIATDSYGNIIIEYGACQTHVRRYCLQAYLSDIRFEGIMKCMNVLFSIEKHCRVMEKTPQERLDSARNTPLPSWTPSWTSSAWSRTPRSTENSPNAPPTTC